MRFPNTSKKFYEKKKNILNKLKIPFLNNQILLILFEENQQRIVNITIISINSGVFIRKDFINI